MTSVDVVCTSCRLPILPSDSKTKVCDKRGCLFHPECDVLETESLVRCTMCWSDFSICDNCDVEFELCKDGTWCPYCSSKLCYDCEPRHTSYSYHDSSQEWECHGCFSADAPQCEKCGKEMLIPNCDQCTALMQTSRRQYALRQGFGCTYCRDCDIKMKTEMLKK